MARFSFFGDQEHKVFDYKPMYYDKEKEEIRKRFASVDGSLDKEKEDKGYVPGSYIRGSMRDGAYQRSRGTHNRAQNIIGLVGLLLVAAVLVYIAKFYMML